ncbi:MAG: hypothetical protein WD278_05955 [Pirellulales bacterium]
MDLAEETANECLAILRGDGDDDTSYHDWASYHGASYHGASRHNWSD